MLADHLSADNNEPIEDNVNKPEEIKPATGKLGVLLPGFGAVATTFVAGVEGARQGLAKPIGSLTQMNTIRLGKRTDDKTPLIKDFVPLAGLEDLVFGTWDPIPDNGYESAVNAGVLRKEDHLDPIKDFLSAIKPMKAAFSPDYVKKLESLILSEYKKGGFITELKHGTDGILEKLQSKAERRRRKSPETDQSTNSDLK